MSGEPRDRAARTPACLRVPSRTFLPGRAVLEAGSARVPDGVAVLLLPQKQLFLGPTSGCSFASCSGNAAFSVMWASPHPVPRPRLGGDGRVALRCHVAVVA